MQLLIALVTFFGAASDVEAVREIYDGAQSFNIVCVNAAMAAFVRNDCGGDALRILERLGNGGDLARRGLECDAATVATALSLSMSQAAQ